jgi:hypothetical protein
VVLAAGLPVLWLARQRQQVAAVEYVEEST